MPKGIFLRSPEHIEKIRTLVIQKNKLPMSEETKNKIRAAHIGKPLTEDHKQKIRESNKRAIRKPMSEKHKENLHRAVSLPKSEEQKAKLRAAMLGRKHTEEAKEKIGNACRGNKSPNWKGGVSFEPYCPKFTREFKERVRTFFNHTCQMCGTPQNGENLTVHHCNYNKNTCCDTDIPLFVPLCRSCHGKTQKNREYWQQHFAGIINTYYEGKCYLSKEEYTALQCQSNTGSLKVRLPTTSG